MQTSNLLETVFKGLIAAAAVQVFTRTTPNPPPFQPPIASDENRLQIENPPTQLIIKLNATQN